ncbi:SIR2 family NAD-dependent protein deacylase [Phyllobacterium sp. 22229]|uniref:SIR2 family NAD-dependent protein deacylase n=1 Tax=Phyllobacterium sp. 22229 TaxID=3453895 RepID=UPI003F82B327
MDFNMIDGGTSAILNNFRDLPDFSAFEDFARSLWQNEAAVMVGAGFSRVCIREKDSRVPPLWSTFKTSMETALGYPQGAGPDALRLAQEYQTLHGENGMDQLIHHLIADSQWEPGPLHKQLLEFPWRDVLTTNWDTLLERTKPQTPDRIYSYVRTVQDIAHRAQPRIVKLHGSMPSHKPFIFTEDDYRTYPVRFAPFVNLAQQVMLEHDLCLIGFSGVDPNFLAWSGWVRDTLNVSARRIRLVGVLELSHVSRALLERRNVTPIDLAPLVEDLHPDERHERALELFFAALLASKPPSPYTWGIGPDKFSQSSAAKEEDRPSRVDVAKAWAKDRNVYPGWIVGPNLETHRLRYSHLSLRIIDEQAEAHLRFSLERIWRHRTARIWLNLEDMEDADAHYESAGKCLTIPEKVELCASIAAEWRFYQKWDEWTRWMARLESIGSSEASLHHTYEVALRALLDWDDHSVQKAAGAIKSDEPIWMMRRAGLLATQFRHREAAELYQTALLSIRQKLLSSPKSAWLISLEGWASMFHRVSFSALSDDCFSLPRDESDETRMRYVAAKSDPWETISSLERLASERIDRNRNDAEQWKLSFKSGRYSRGGTRRLGGDDECPFYGLLELIERTGAPEHIANVNMFSSRLETAYRAITTHDENDLLTFFARYRGSEKKVLDWMIPRMHVARLSDSAVQHFLLVIPRRIDSLAILQDRFGAESHLTFLIELLARVIVRASSTQAFEIFHWVVNLLNRSTLSWTSYSACRAVLEGAIEAMEPDERQKAMDIALHMKTPGEARAKGLERDWPEIFDGFSETDAEMINISLHHTTRINSLITLVRDDVKLDRGRALRRLHILFRAGKLTEEQTKLLDTSIWVRCDESGWPSDTEVHPWLFLELPGKARAEALFIEKIVGGVASGQIGHQILMNLRAGLDRTETVVPKETLVSCVKSCLMWKPASTEEKNPIDRLLLGNDGFDQATGREIGEVLARSLLPRLEAEDLPQDIARQLKAPEKLPHIPSLAATAFQVARLWPEHQSVALRQIRYAVASREPSRVYPAFIAVKQIIKNTSVYANFPREIKELLLHACEQRTQPGLSSALSLLGNMFENHQLNDDDIERLSSALPHVLNEYRYDQKNLEVPAMAELPTVRREVHRLSKLLLHHSSELEQLKLDLDVDPLPEVRILN